VLHIHALIWVEKASHKPIVIGNKGLLLKEVGREAREDMQRAFDQKVFLQLWVKVKEGWADDERALQSLGYDEN
jgi:GTP-binding protein Era